MASEPVSQGSRILTAALGWLQIFFLNTWRRLIILGRYTIICFHQQRLRRAWRLLGKEIHQAVDGGEVNPMLTGVVKDSLARAQAVKALKDGHYQAIAALREKIRASRTEEAPPAGETGAAAGETPPGTAAGSQEGRS